MTCPLPHGFLVALASVLLLPAANASQGRSFALIIGYNGSLDPETPPLRYADDDAIQYARLFDELGIKVILLVEPDPATRQLYPTLHVDGPPNRASIKEAISQINVAMGDEGSTQASAFYLVYAGHGDVRQGEGHVTLADGPLNRSDFFAGLLDQVHADVKHVVVDACKSYFLVFDRGAGEERVPYGKPFDKTEELSTRPNTGFLLSTSSSQNSHEWEAFQAGVFSHEVRSALRGAADVTQDDRILYSELAAFVQTANSSIPNEKYRPRFLAIPPVGNDTFVDLNRSGPARVVFDTTAPHHFFIEDPDGVRLADLRPGRDPVRLRLPETRVLYVHDVDMDVEHQIPAHGIFLLSALTPERPRTAMRGAANEAFNKLFRVPFDRSTYEESRLATGLWERQQPPALAATMAPERRGLGPWVWTGIGATTALASLGGLFRIIGNQRFDEYKNAAAAAQPRLRRETERLDHYALYFFGAAGVAAATTVVSYVLLDSGE